MYPDPSSALLSPVTTVTDPPILFLSFFHHLPGLVSHPLLSQPALCHGHRAVPLATVVANQTSTPPPPTDLFHALHHSFSLPPSQPIPVLADRHPAVLAAPSPIIASDQSHQHHPNLPLIFSSFQLHPIL